MIWNVNDRRLEQRIMESKGYLVVLFLFPDSVPCRHFKSEYETLADLMQGDFEFLRINADENPAISAQCRITAAPTVLLYRDGDEIGRFEGPYTHEALKHRIMDAILMKKKRP